MTISTKDWVNYINRLREINETAANIMREYVQKNGFGNTNELIQLAYAVADKYGNAAAELTCQMYEATAEAQGVYVQAAEPAETPTYAEVAKAVNGTIDSPETMCNAVGRLTKRTGADTMLKNALRDGAEFAWVPHGDTCAFCITLASRGWQKASKKALKNGHAEHIHANCDCQYAVRFDGKSNVSGYDPDKYLKMYNGNDSEAEPKEKIRLLRNEIREDRKKEINEKKREWYNSAEQKMLRLAKQGNIFVSKSDELSKYAEKIVPINGYTDIVAHGDPYSIVFRDQKGNEENVGAEEFCRILEKAGIKKGQKIRLIACETGAGDGIVPTYIARRFDTEVMAPTEIVNVDFNGNMILANNIEDAKMGIETGEWIRFNKEGKME